jgi:2-dehydro-3-deoxyphosphogalactonate aldolase
MNAELLLESMPLVAILRGLSPAQAVAVGQVLHASGLRVVEVPLNSPEPFVSISKLSESLGASCVCGAGTVLTTDDVKRTYDAGGRLIVSPNCDARVIECALALNMLVMPGVATATEVFSAVHAGAKHLKLFPAASYGAGHLKALRDVLPQGINIYPVGGITAMDIAAWLQVGAAGFGFGSELYRPSYTLAEIEQRAQQVVAAFQQERN